MVDLYLVSLLYRNDGGYGHAASLEKAGSNEEAEGRLRSAVEGQGVKVLSVSSQKMKIGWY